MASKVITVVVGSENIKVSEVAYTSQNEVTVYAADTVKTPLNLVDDGEIKNNAVLAEVIKKVITEKNMTAKSVIFSLQSSKVASKEVLVPFMKESKISAWIDANAEDIFPVSNTNDSFVRTYEVLETFTDVGDVKKMRITAASAPSFMVEQYYKVAEILGLNVTAVDYVGNATIKFLSLQTQSDDTTLMVLMGDDSTVISILRNKTLQLTRTVPYGKNTALNALMGKKDIDEDMAIKELSTTSLIKSSFAEGDMVTNSLKYLINNIGRVMDYYTNKNAKAPIEHAMLLTEGEYFQGLNELFSKELRMSFEKITDCRGVKKELSYTSGDISATRYVQNIGCVVKPANFLPGTVREKVKENESNRYVMLAALATVVLSVVLVGVPFVSNLQKKSEKKDVQANIDSISSIREKAAEYYQAKDQVTDICNFYNLAYNRNDYLGKLFDYLHEKLPSDISISNFLSENGSVSISFQGSGKTTYADLLLILKACPYISDVKTPSFSESMDSFGTITLSSSGTYQFTFVDPENFISKYNDELQLTDDIAGTDGGDSEAKEDAK